MNRPTLAVVSFAIGVSVALPIAALAGGRPPRSAYSGALDRQTAVSQEHQVRTGSLYWRNVPGLNGVVVCAQNEIAVTVSMLYRKGYVPALRVAVDGSRLLSPGVIKFPGVFTWVDTVADGTHTIDVQWRRTGGPAVSGKATVNVLYESGTACS